MALLVKDIRRRWPGNCLVYSFGDALTPAEEGQIEAAMQDWKDSRQVRFIKRTTQDRYVTFEPDFDPLDGICSSSELGMGGGQQFIHLDHDPAPGTLRHEIGHALGFYHEHKRRDRNSFINWNKEQTKLNHQSQFERVGVGEALQPSYYDLDSVMHYGAAESLSLNGMTKLITTDKRADRNRIGSQEISMGDVDAVALMTKGSQHVYQLTGNGQIENMVQQSEWSAGWTIARPYTIGLDKFLMLLKTSNGRMSLYRINLDGTVSVNLQQKTWTSGWTHAVEYAVVGTNYMLLYKRGDGTVHVNKINADGKIGEKIDEGATESGWDYVAPFGVGTSNFMLFSNLIGEVFVHEIEWDGKLGQRKHEQRFGDYDITQPYNVLGTTFLLMLKRSNATLKIRRINPDGRIGDRIQTLNWTSGWTTAIPYHVGIDTYLLSLKESNGELKINRINSDGKLGSIVDARLLSPGWGTVTVYGVGLGTYVLLVNA